MFVFSGGWFNNFLDRWNISCRAITKKASRLPDEYFQLVINWLRFNRRNSQPGIALEELGLLQMSVVFVYVIFLTWMKHLSLSSIWMERPM